MLSLIETLLNKHVSPQRFSNTPLIISETIFTFSDVYQAKRTFQTNSLVNVNISLRMPQLSKAFFIYLFGNFHFTSFRLFHHFSLDTLNLHNFVFSWTHPSSFDFPFSAIF